MGSIQALRSWALSSRANEDTDVQVSGFLGNVNKSLGKQIVGILDQLQGVIGERTKAYNSLVASINKSIDGKGGVAEKSIVGAFGGVKTVFSLVLLAAGKLKTAAVISLVTTAIGNALKKEEVEATVAGAVYDYEKMASQLGYAQFSGTINDDAPDQFRGAGLTTGASRFLDMRDALMPRYNYQDDITTAGVNYTYHSRRGFVGTLRRN